MKKSLFSLSMLAIALTTGSCINNFEKDQAVADGDRAIAFNVWANKQTRAGATKAADVADFVVPATNPAAGTVLIDGLVVTGNTAAGLTVRLLSGPTWVR